MAGNMSRAAPLTDYHDEDDGQSENVNEAMFLFVTAAVGFVLNLGIICCILICKHLRRMTSAFLLHGCTLDMIKCGYCVPFATSLLRNHAPSFCTMLGGSYVLVVTASGFNIVAMVCCEAYTFSEHNVGADGNGSLCCVVFGLVMVYIGSIIIHLGPTIIGGNFNYNDLIGNCIFQYGTIKSYVVHAMWIAIMTLAMIGAVYYLFFFYRHIHDNSTHRIASLVRATMAISGGKTCSNKTIRKMIQDSLSRARVLMTITALFILCWYPLFILTLVDPHFKMPTKIYKLLTFIAWSNSALNPIVLILFDRKVSICRCVQRAATGRCCSDDMDETPDTPLMPTTSCMGTPNRSGSRNLSVPTATVYQRVGCRLCQEGQSHSNTQCNGGVGESVLVHESSICELHNLTMC